MSPTQSPPDGEMIPPMHPDSPAEAYSPAQVRRRREFSVWDPRSAPGTYLLLAVNIAVYLWMIAHHVDPKLPSERALLHAYRSLRGPATLGSAGLDGSVTQAATDRR